MDFSPIGDTAWRLVGFDSPPLRPAAAARLVREAGIPGILSVVAAPAAIGVFFDPEASGAAIREAVERVLADPRAAAEAPAGKTVEIPVDYNGIDLEELATLHGMDRAELVERHTAPLYTVSAIGFAPGFPYLEGLDPALHTPRRGTPRTCVPAGGVAIGGAHTGIYPRSSPGGWHVIGRTPAVLFDPFASPPSLLQVGDQVRFRRAGDSGVAAGDPAPISSPLAKTPGGFLEILRAWPGTAVRDRGRQGFFDQGVSPAGPLDPAEWHAMQLAVGNTGDSAGIEWMQRGPVVRFGGACVIASNALPSAHARPAGMAAGAVADFSHSGRGCLAVCGGLDVPLVLGSAAKDPSAGFGGLFGRDLVEGDILPLRAPKRMPPVNPPWSVARPRTATSRPVTLRVVAGPDAPDGEPPPFWRLIEREFHVSPVCSRMGWRMVESIGSTNTGASMASTPVATGSIQIPPDGCPIILGPDRQTIGGYVQAACVAWIDLPLLADLAPGGVVRFERIALEDAEALRLDAMAGRRMLGAALQMKFDKP